MRKYRRLNCVKRLRNTNVVNTIEIIRNMVDKQDSNRGLFSKQLVFYLYFSYSYWYLLIGYMIVTDIPSRVG